MTRAIQLRSAVRLAAAIAVGIATWQGPAVALGQGSLRQRFVNDASRGWTEYKHRSKRLQGVVTTLQSVLTPEAHAFRMRSEFKQHGECLLNLHQYFAPHEGNDPGLDYPTHGTLLVTNSDYAFGLRRSEVDQPWVLLWVDTDIHDGIQESPANNIDQWLMKPISFDWAYPSDPIDISSPKFIIDNVTPVMDETRELAKVAFQYRPESTNARVPTLVEGWVTLDPELFWIIRALDVRVHRGGSVQERARRYDYSVSADGFPMLTQIAGTTSVPSTSYRAETKQEFELWEGDVALSEFTLSAFGFPEPVTVNPKGSWYFWLGLVGVGCIVAAILFRLRYLRRSPG